MQEFQSTKLKTMTVENTLDILTTEVVQRRVAGFTFEEIAEKLEIPVSEVVSAWREYVDNRESMSREEQWVLHLLRLEDLLKKAHARLRYAEAAEDFELVLKIFDRLEALMALNETRKSDAEAALLQLTNQQTQIILGAMLKLQNSFRQSLEESFRAVAKPTKAVEAIEGEILGSFDEKFLALAQLALMEESQE